MAARAASDTALKSGPAADLGPRVTPCSRDLSVESGADGGAGLVPRARRRLVDALMDAARLRSICHESVRAADTTAEGRPAASDFIGLALAVVAGRCGLSVPVSEGSDPPWPALPALASVSALFQAIDAGGAVPDRESRRFGGPAVQRDLEQLCRLAALPPAAVQAVVATAPEIARLLAELTGAADSPEIATGYSAPALSVVALSTPESQLRRTSVGPGGDNRAEAVVLARLFLRMISAGMGAPQRLGGAAIPRRGIPIYPVADGALFRAVARWRCAHLPPAPRRHVERRLRGAPARWDGEAAAFATLTVGSPDWSTLRMQAGVAGLRLRVIGGTAVVLVDRRLEAARLSMRASARTLSARAPATLTPDACAAMTTAALAFHAETGQVLLCHRLEGSVLWLTVDVDWIDPWGVRRLDADAIDAIADAAPLAAVRLLDAARRALSGNPARWSVLATDGQGDGRRLAIRLATDMLMPLGG